MTLVKLFGVVCLICFALHDVYSAGIESVDGELLNVLLERIESLESSDAANRATIAEMLTDFKMERTRHENEISDLKSKMSEMEAKFKQKDNTMLDQINGLRTTLTEMNDEANEKQQVKEGDFDRQVPPTNNIKRQESYIRKDREFPEKEVAFYATHTDHDIHHIGTNQALLFQQTITNIGNAYNNNTGSFVAPKDGTYVIHATVMGIDLSAGQHMHAHFDVNGSAFSKFYVTSYDQSSQMLVIELHAGDTVTLRNDVLNTGFVGQHYSTFSGFLLYEHFPSTNIVGK